MTMRWLAIAAVVLPALAFDQSAQIGGLAGPAERGPYARIAILRPHEGDIVDFEAGYIRHLDWHRQAKDTWVWYGWSIWAGERQRWFVYATFGHSAASLGSPVNPAEDERDTLLTVVPHAEFAGSGLYEFLPGLSRGNGEPQPTARLEMTTVDLMSGATESFEAALSAAQSALREETLWYRMVAGGAVPRYVRLRPRGSLAAILDERNEQALPEAVNRSVARMTVEILNLRPAMSNNLPPARQ